MKKKKITKPIFVFALLFGAHCWGWFGPNNLQAQNAESWLLKSLSGAVVLHFHKDSLKPSIQSIHGIQSSIVGQRCISTSTINNKALAYSTAYILYNANFDTISVPTKYYNSRSILQLYDSINNKLNIYRIYDPLSKGHTLVKEIIAVDEQGNLNYLKKEHITHLYWQGIVTATPQLSVRAHWLIMTMGDSVKVFDTRNDSLVFTKKYPNVSLTLKASLSRSGEWIVYSSKRLVVCSINRNNGKVVPVFDFINAIVSFAQKYESHDYFIADACLSPNDRFLYTQEYLHKKTVSPVSDTSFICQYDMHAGSADDIFATRTVLYQSTGRYNFFDSKGFFTELKLTVNNQIAFTNPQRNFDYLGLIKKPNKKGQKCELDTHAIYLNGDTLAVSGKSFPNNPIFPERKLRLGKDTSICFGDSLLLKPRVFGHDLILWQNGDTSSQVWIKQTGTYHLKVLDAWGAYYDTIQIQIIPKPELTISGDTALCQLQSVNLSAKSDATLKWSTGESTETISVDTFGTYTVTATNTIGCRSERSLQVSKLPMPVSWLSDSTICGEDEIILKAGPINQNYLWQNGSNSAQIKADTNAWFRVRISLGKCSINDSAYVGYSDEDSCYNSLFFPNAFSPNNDEKSDIFSAKGLNYQIHLFQVFSRTGQMVFNSTDNNGGWNGEFKGEKCPTGAYLYHIQYSLKTQSGFEEHAKNGWVVLVR